MDGVFCCPKERLDSHGTHLFPVSLFRRLRLRLPLSAVASAAVHSTPWPPPNQDVRFNLWWHAFAARQEAECASIPRWEVCSGIRFETPSPFPRDKKLTLNFLSVFLFWEGEAPVSLCFCLFCL